MANQDHLKILKQGIPMWNDWRANNPLIEPNLLRAYLSRANLGLANFKGTNLKRAVFSGAVFTGANLYLADLTDATLNQADLSRVILNGAILNRANLEQADLSNSNLRGVILKEANLSEVNLSGADLSGADLSGANLSGADLSGANLSDADLSEVDLSRAHLVGAGFNATNLTAARFSYTVLVNIDLSTTKGVISVQHSGPSSIGIDSVYRSKGKIPEVFLRGCGVPEPFIVNMKSLVAAMSSIEFYSCFISYSHNDQTLAERLHNDLQAKGVRCWFAPEDLRIGDKLRSSFDEAIRLHDKLLVLLSENSVKSSWVEKEVETAFEKEGQQNRTVLFPIRLDDAVMKTNQAWAADIRRTRHVGDFRDWKNHDFYKKAFNRLLRDLQAKTG